MLRGVKLSRPVRVLRDMRLRRLLLAPLLLGLLVAPLATWGAQPFVPPIQGGEDIPVEEWRKMAMGKTLVYRIEGQLWAYERYFPGTNQVMLQLYDGKCMQGTWDYVEPLYCFHWDVEGTACFRHARRGDDILILEAGSADRLPLIQMMTEVTDAPLTCSSPIS
jgi:hypothetical protein